MYIYFIFCNVGQLAYWTEIFGHVTQGIHALVKITGLLPVASCQQA